MKKRIIKGSSIRLNSDINIAADEVIFSGKKSKTWEDLKQPFKDESKTFNKILPKLLGSINVTAGVPSEKDKLMLKLLGAISVCGSVDITKEADGLGYEVSYTNVLNRVRSRAKESLGKLSENEIKEEMYKIISEMLEKSGPAFVSWNHLLIKLMKENSLEDFLKGARAAICAMTGDPVNANTGNFIYTKEDLSIGGVVPLSFTRFYNSKADEVGVMGKGWRHSYEISLSIEKDSCIIHLSDGQDETYFIDDDENIISIFDDFNCLERYEEGFRYKSKEGAIYTFNKEGRLETIKNKEDIGLNFYYDNEGKLKKVSNGLGSSFEFEYDHSSRLSLVKDHTGRKIKYSYTGKQLGSAYDESGLGYTYYYENELLTKIRNPRGVYVLDNAYDGNDRVVVQKFADGGIIKYEYYEEQSRTLVRNQNEKVEAYTHDENFRNISTERGEAVETFTYDDRNLLTSYTDKMGNKTEYSYDKAGNRIKTVHPDGQTERAEYDENRVTAYFIDDIKVVENTYDDKGRIIESKNALGISTKFKYEDNEKINITLPDGSESLISLDERGNISSIKEETGKVTHYEYDKLNRVTLSIDGKGNKTAFTYNDKDLITKVVDALGNSCEYSYSENRKLTEFKNFNGAVTKFDYNEMNKIKSFTLPDGGVFNLEYDLMQNVVKEIFPDGGSIKYTYDEYNNIEKQEFQNGGIYHYEYDLNGNRTSETDPLGNKTKFNYDERGRLLSYEDALGAVTTYTYTKNTLSITDDMGNVRKLKYDELGKLIEDIGIDGIKKEYEYNELGKVTLVKVNGKDKVRYKYHKGGLVHKAFYTDKRYEIFSYDENLNLIKRENDKGDYIEFVYDKLNRIVEVKNSFSQKQSFVYDSVGNLIEETDTLGNTTKYAYSLSGNLTSVLDAMGNRTEYAYDIMGRLITVYRHEGDSFRLEDLEKEIQKEEHYVKVTNEKDLEEKKLNAPRIMRYYRNLMGEIECIKNSFGEEEHFSYDLTGKVISKIDREGYETKYTYTELGDIENILYADERKVEYTYNSLRQLIKIKDVLGEINIELDKLGRAKKVIDYKGRETKYKLGAFGERLELEYPDGKKVKYNYDDELNLIKLISDSKEINYAYDDYGRLIRKDIPENISSIYTYNERGLLESLTHLQKERKLEKYSYLYDLAGNKISISRKRSAQETYIDVEDPEKIEEKLWEDSSVFNYEYDKLNRLISVKRDNQKFHSYSYDAFGNRLTFESKDSNIHYIYNALDQLVEEKGVYPNRKYSYDKRGNLKSVLSGGELIRGYEYDTSDRLSLSYNFSGQAKNYIYDGLGNRIGNIEYRVDKDELKDISKDILQELDIVSKEEYLLDITKPYHNLLQRNEKFRNIEHSQSFIWDYNTAFMEEEDKTYAYLEDEIGSPIRLIKLGETEETKQMVYGYDEFGVDTYKTQGKIQPFGYTGYRHDKVADTYFAQAREYMPSVGRFGGEDWIKGNIEKPFSLNQYGYCWGNPMGLVDRDGKTPEMASNYSQVFDILKTGAEMAGVAALADSPVPGPMDLVALGILGITLVASGGVAVGTYINSKAKEKEEARIIALEQVKTKRPKQTVIYRGGSGNATNLTPRPRDIDDGLSYELSVTPDIADKYTMTTIEAVNATGVLEAVIDRPNHVSVRPVNPLEMMEWINSRPTAKENPYYLTKILASISIRDNGGPCNVSSD